MNPFLKPIIRVCDILMLAIVLVCAVCAVAYANDPTAVTPGAEATVLFLEKVVFPVIFLLISGLISLAILALRKKYHLDISEKQENAIFDAITKGIDYAEEIAKQKVKNSNIKITGQEKLDLAIKKGMELVPHIKVNRDKAEALAHAALARIGGGASERKTESFITAIGTVGHPEAVDKKTE